jgi:preprotein translocase subunit SecG
MSFVLYVIRVLISLEVTIVILLQNATETYRHSSYTGKYMHSTYVE